MTSPLRAGASADNTAPAPDRAQRPAHALQKSRTRSEKQRHKAVGSAELSPYAPRTPSRTSSARQTCSRCRTCAGAHWVRTSLRGPTLPPRAHLGPSAALCPVQTPPGLPSPAAVPAVQPSVQGVRSHGAPMLDRPLPWFRVRTTALRVRATSAVPSHGAASQNVASSAAPSSSFDSVLFSPAVADTRGENQVALHTESLVLLVRISGNSLDTFAVPGSAALGFRVCRQVCLRLGFPCRVRCTPLAPVAANAAFLTPRSTSAQTTQLARATRMGRCPSGTLLTSTNKHSCHQTGNNWTRAWITCIYYVHRRRDVPRPCSCLNPSGLRLHLSTLRSQPRLAGGATHLDTAAAWCAPLLIDAPAAPRASTAVGARRQLEAVRENRSPARRDRLPRSAPLTTNPVGVNIDVARRLEGRACAEKGAASMASVAEERSAASSDSDDITARAAAFLSFWIDIMASAYRLLSSRVWRRQTAFDGSVQRPDAAVDARRRGIEGPVR